MENKNEENILPDGTILYCIKDYNLFGHGNDDWYANKGDRFMICRYDGEDKSYLTMIIDDNNNEVLGRQSPWFYNSYENYKDENMETFGYLWDHFITKEQKAERIRNIAESFIK